MVVKQLREEWIEKEKKKSNFKFEKEKEKERWVDLKEEGFKLPALAIEEKNEEKKLL